MVFVNLLVKPVWLVLENNVQNQIGHAAFGTFMALFSFTFIFTSFTDLGIYHYFTKQVAARPSFMSEYLPTVLPFKFLVSVLFPLFILLTGWVIGYSATELYYLIFISLIFTFTQFIQFLRGILQAHQHFNLDSVMSVLERFILIGIVVVLLYQGITLTNYVYARFTSVLLTLVFIYFLFRKKYEPISLKWSWSKLGMVLKASFPFAVINLVYGINEKIDMVMLERLASSQEAGIYAGAYRWIDAVMMYLWTILPIFFAKFAASYQKTEEQQSLLKTGQVVISVPIIFVSVFIFYFGDKVFWQFNNSTPSELKAMHLSLQILFAHVLVNGFFAIYSTLLTASNREIVVSKLVGVSIVINVTLNFLFIPEFGSVAASINTLISTLMVSLGNVLLSKSKIGIQVPFILIIKLIMCTGVLAGAFYVLQVVLESWWVISILAGLLFLLILPVFRVINLAELKADFTRGTD